MQPFSTANKLGAIKMMAVTCVAGLVGALSACGGSVATDSLQLTSIAVGPPQAKVAKGLTTAFSATGIYSNGSRQDIAASVAWTSSNPSIASVSNSSGSNGLVTALNTGSTVITATLGGVSGTTTLTVTGATLVSIGVTPTSPHIAVGLTQSFTATGVYTDNSTLNVTSSVTWSSANLDVVAISNSKGANGLATMVGGGSTVITATLGDLSGTTPLTVTGATLVSLGVTPANIRAPVGPSPKFAATGVYSDNSTHDLSAVVTWSSSDSTVATISNASGSIGLATTIKPGSTTITATLGAISGTTPFTVTSATLASIGVTPAAPSVAAGLTRQFTATGVYSDNSSYDITTLAVWSSSITSVATISNASSFNGVATALNPGSTTVTATLGSVSGSAVFTVTAATLVSIGVTPPNAGIAIGTTEQFTATGTYTDNSTQNLTAVAAWSSSATNVASVSNAAGSSGLATALSQGLATITAAFGGTSGSGTLTVSSARLTSIAVAPQTISIADDTSQQFMATGSFSDNSTQDLTAEVAWTSSDSATALVSNAPGFNGLATALDLGSTTIAAALGNVSGSASMTVTDAPLVSIAVTPANPTIPDGSVQQFTAIGTYADNTTRNLTSLVTWSSSDSTVSTVSNASGSNGSATALGVGSTTIAAAFAGVSVSATLTVTSATLVSIAVTPLTATIASGANQQFTATGTFTDNSTENLTTTVTWSSSSQSVASISNASGSQGLATGASVGSASISAASGSITSPTVMLNVSVAQQYTYVANDGDGTVSQYSIGAAGALTALNPATAAAGADPESIVVDPTGRYAYVANNGDGTISQYTLVAGLLTAMSPATASAGNNPQSIVIDPTGRYAYGANDGDGNVSQYTIGSTGALTAMSPATVPSGSYPQSIAVDPTGRYVYVANADGTISQYSIGPGGLLSAMSPATVTAGSDPQCIAVDPTGRFAYVANGIDDTLSEYSIGASGGLSAMSPATVATDVDPEAVIVDPTGRYVYVANEVGTISQYTVGAGGTLTAMNPATVQAGTAPQSITVDRTGHYLYVANDGDNTVSQFAIGAGGGLSSSTSAIVSTGSGPYSITTAY